MNKYLWKFHWNCGRSGSLDGLFVATEQEVEDMIGCEAYFGEVLGKHSEVYGQIEQNDIRKLDVSSDSVEEVSKVLGNTWSGFNPMNYVKRYCEICEENYTVDEADVEFREELDITACWECYQEELKRQSY